MFENSLSDIFTEPNDAIFSDGSIDPMGLRIIWTSMGNKIFGNRLNTISTDIRFFTLNLFHHSVIEACTRKYEEQFSTLVGNSPYNNSSDLYDGLVIFLECLMTHSLLYMREKMREGQIGLIPGMSKLRTMIDGKSGDKMVTEIEVNRGKGILVRHHLLGIHGRHKNPFREMGIFGQTYYQNMEIWKTAEKIFSVSPWRELREKLISLIGTQILVQKRTGSSFLKTKVIELPLMEMCPLYFACLQPNIYSDGALVSFWEARLGLLDGTANLLYSELKKTTGKLLKDAAPDYASIIKAAVNQEADKHGSQLRAICAIEPLLACFDKVSNRILARKTSSINDLLPFVEKWQSTTSVSPSDILPFLHKDFMDPSALFRLKELLHIFSYSSTAKDFIEEVVKYHKKIMNNRGVLPWISISNHGEIKHNRSYYFTNEQFERLEVEEWVNSYYLPTVFRLYKGLYN